MVNGLIKKLSIRDVSNKLLIRSDSLDTKGNVRSCSFFYDGQQSGMLV